MSTTKRRSLSQRLNTTKLKLENLEARRLLAADLVSLAPSIGQSGVDEEANLVLNFSEDVQKGPGTGNISVYSADDGALVEVVNVNSDRVTFDGSTVTIDLVDNLSPQTNYAVQIDPSAIRDTGSTTDTAVLMAEDFESLDLRDSDMASDDIIIDVNDYVVVISGVLDVKVAGEYTFGINSDDGQQLAIDVEQDGLDLIDDEIIYDNTTHGTQDRLSTCGVDFGGQSCVDDSVEDAISLDVGEYAFEFWYFERGGGSSGEFFYAPGFHETFSAADFVLVGDDSKGIGVTAEGITATTYKSASEEIGTLDAALDLVEGLIDSAENFPASASIPTADVWNSGGPGRFPDNNGLPGYPPNQAGDGTDWTDEGPTGWTRDNSDLRVEDPNGATGRDEYRGWVFLDKYFWINQQGNQNRTAFTKGENVVALVDPDAYDDDIEIGPDSEPDPDGDGVRDASFFDASLSSPPIYLDGVATNSASLTFDSSWRDEDYQTAVVEVEYFDGDGESIGINELLRWESQPGDNFHDDNENETVTLDLQNPDGAASLIITWDMPVAANDWWWAIDNIVVSGNVTGDTFEGFDRDDPWTFDTFGAPTIGIVDSAMVNEDGGPVTLAVTRQGSTASAVSVTWTATPGTASPADFSGTSGTIEFAEGQSEATFTIDIVNDDIAEVDETFSVALTSVTGDAVLDGEQDTATVSIVDDDRPVIVFQQGVEVTIDGDSTGVVYEGTTDADPAGASPDTPRDLDQLNPDGEDGGSEVHGLTAFKDIFGEQGVPDGAVITKATLTLNITNEGTPVRVHRLLGDFNEEEVTWNDLTLNGNTEPGLQADGIEAVEIPTTEFNAPAEVTDVDVTADVQAWFSGESENFGWGFLPTGTNGVDWDSSEADSAPNRPKLTIEFVIPTEDEVLPGDVNRDGMVDFADFLLLSGSYGDEVEPNTGADFDGSGVIDFPDFLVLSQNFGTSAAAAVDAVFASTGM